MITAMDVPPGRGAVVEAHSSQPLADRAPWLSVVVPVLNEASLLPGTLAPLQTWRGRGIEVIVVDGGSQDATVQVATSLCDHCITSRRGRAVQMNAGARRARGQLLWFLHADTRVSDASLQALKTLSQKIQTPFWGCFDVRLDAEGAIYRLIGRMISLRSRISAFSTGDQAQFVTRNLFAAGGGFADLPLMEDLDFCRRLKRLMRPLRCTTPVITSARRWSQQGPWKTIFLMWRLRWLYASGVPAGRLAPMYRAD